MVAEVAEGIVGPGPRGVEIPQVYLSLGGNLGEPVVQFAKALSSLHQRADTQVLQVSPLYLSAAVGPPQPDYINGCVCIRTGLSPHQLRLELKALEAAQGRDHAAARWSARPLDMDILLYDQLTLDDELLTIPHPELYQRNFVLVPLLDLEPQLSLPDGRRLDRILQELNPMRLEPLSPPVEIMEMLNNTQQGEDS